MTTERFTKMGRKAKERKGYFYEKEEQAIVDYLNAETKEEKDKIFNETLEPAFNKMIESIIRRYRLYIPEEEFCFTFNDVASYLITKLNNFDVTKGYKAYSYCGTICKNYLYYKSKQFAKNQNRSIPFDLMADELNNIGYTPVEQNEDFEVSGMIKKISIEIGKMIDNPMLNGLKADELRVGVALKNLLDNWESILMDSDGSNKLMKSSVLFYLTETTNLSAKKVRNCIKPYKEIYALLKEIAVKEEE